MSAQRGRWVAPWEHELLYRYALAELRAKELGVTIASNRKEYVVRDANTKQVIARHPTIMEVEKELTNYALVIRLKTAGPVALKEAPCRCPACLAGIHAPHEYHLESRWITPK